MYLVDSLTQVAYLLAFTAACIGLVEGSLYWFLYRFDDRKFVLGSALMGLVGGIAVTWKYELWQQAGQPPPSLMAGAAIGTVSLVGVALVAKVLKGRYRIPAMMLAPGLLAIALLMIYPFFFEFKLAFHNLNMYTIRRWMAGEPLTWVGFQNFIEVFTSSPLQSATFWTLLVRTLVWTVVNVVFHVLFGLALAMLLNKPIKGKGFYRTLLIVPWAMPAVVSILVWRGEFHPQFGFVNILLGYLGLDPVSWWSDPTAVFASCVLVNIWLGIPFMMVVFLGGLQSISPSYYEAAAIDGASKWAQFTQITLPLLKPTVIPSVTLGTIWTFNNVNVIYLMTGQDGGNEYADILISALYKSAFTYSRFSFSAAFAVVIFMILLMIAGLWLWVSKGTEEVRA